MRLSPRLRVRLILSSALGLLAATIAVGLPPTADRPTAVRAEAPLPPELQLVPHDAAFFLYADVAGLWNNDLFQKLRAGDKETFGQLEALATGTLKVKIGDLKSLVVFFPKIKDQPDTSKLGLVATFSQPIDKAKFSETVAGLFPKGAKVIVRTPTDRMAVVLMGLGEEFAKPQPADADGHLTPALRAAATGKHVLVAGTTLGNLPDEIRGDNLPAPVRQFQPLLASQAVYATLELGKSLTLDVRVKTKRATQAADAEKALAAFVKLITDEAAGALPDLKKEATGSAGLTDLVKVLETGLTALKGAKFAINDTEARATLTLPLNDLPIVSAYQGAVLKVRQAASTTQSANNLKQIAIAMHNYHDTHGNFPPAAVCDKKGKPQLSWRVLILPYIEQNELYKQFKLDEPWDSENNKKLLAKMPKVYAVPGKGAPGATDTYYRAFVGNGAGWDWIMGGKFQNITDGTSNTLMVVTAADAVPWTKPDELEFDPTKDMTKLIGLVVNGKAQVAMFDGSVRTLSKVPEKKTLNALITKNGGEVVPNDF